MGVLLSSALDGDGAAWLFFVNSSVLRSFANIDDMPDVDDGVIDASNVALCRDDVDVDSVEICLAKTPSPSFLMLVMGRRRVNVRHSADLDRLDDVFLVYVLMAAVKF
jgi:hypothetical protein